MAKRAMNTKARRRPPRWTRLIALNLVVLALALAAVVAAASEQPSGTFGIPWWTADTGGGSSSGGEYSVRGTAGQPDVGGAGHIYVLRGGFWGVVLESCPTDFTDVPVDNAFYTFVRCLACKSIISGYADGTFQPNNSVTRGQLSKIVANSAGFSEDHTEQTFQDVPLTGTFYIFIERLASRSIIAGYTCGGPGEPCVPPDNRPYFRPNNNVTRGQTSKITAIARGLPDPPAGQQTFQDVLQSSTFWTWIEALATTGAISGYTCGGPGEPCVPPNNRPYFRPNNNVTRGQSAKIVANTFFPGCSVP